MATVPADAVHVSRDGQGQALIFPYYTVRNGFATLISVSNTQTNTKVLKVRFLEGKNGREVMDFNLFLAPNDTWTGAVIATQQGARLVTADNSCVTPHDLFTEARRDSQNLALNEFKPYAYTGAKTDAGAFSSLDRTREGYFEVLEMGVIDNDEIDGNPLVIAFPGHNTVGFVTPNSTTGIPPNCQAMDAYDPLSGNPTLSQFPGPAPGTTGAFLFPPRGGLTGRVSLIDADRGSNFTYAATALDAWSDRVNYGSAGSGKPTLADANPPVSQIIAREGTISAAWPDTVAGRRDAVSAALMHASVTNEFILDIGTASQTDWIVTLPTKRFYGTGTSTAEAPFGENFSNSGSCDAHEGTIFNREAGTAGTPPPVLLPVQPPTVAKPPTITCWASSVLVGGRSSLIGSTNVDVLTGSNANFLLVAATTVAGLLTTPSLRDSISGPSARYTMRFDITENVPNPRRLTPTSATLIRTNGQIVPLSPAYHFGLPVVGFAMHNFSRSGVQAKYGSVIPHTFAVRVE